jgi:hypothetical protein
VESLILRILIEGAHEDPNQIFPRELMPGSEEKEGEGGCEAAAEVEALAAGEAEPAGGGRVVAQAPARHPLLLYTPAEYMDKHLKGLSSEIDFQCILSRIERKDLRFFFMLC